MDLNDCEDVGSLPRLVRSLTAGAFALVESSALGARYRAAPDPDGVAIPDRLWLPRDFPRIPASVWRPWARLAVALARGLPGRGALAGEASEVGVILARSVEDGFRSWRAFVPRQRVGTVAVHSDLTDLTDLVTGERFEQGIPDGWAHAGSSHSHHRMGAFFSKQDDRSELGVPGVHAVIGDVDPAKGTYDIAASICLDGRRYRFPCADLIDAASECEGTYHPSVLECITHEREARPLVHADTGDDIDYSWLIGRWREEEKREPRAPLGFRFEADGDESELQRALRLARSLAPREARAVRRLVDAVRAIPGLLSPDARDVLSIVARDALDTLDDAERAAEADADTFTWRDDATGGES